MSTIKEIREKRGIKKQAVADHLGVSRHTYSNYENNQEVMSIAQARAVCEFLNVPLEEIFLSKKVK